MVVAPAVGNPRGAVAAPIAMAVIQGYFDLKKREDQEKQILSEQEIMDLKPDPHYAAGLLALRDIPPMAARHTPAVQAAAPVPARVEEGPEAPTDEVADPSLLVPPKPPAAPDPGPDRPAADGVKPPPE